MDTSKGKIIISGGKPLVGEIPISGMKNAAVPILFSTILTEDKCIIENLPDISDVKVSLKILEEIGVKVTRHDKNTVEIVNHFSHNANPLQHVLEDCVKDFGWPVKGQKMSNLVFEATQSLSELLNSVTVAQMQSHNDLQTKKYKLYITVCPKRFFSPTI